MTDANTALLARLICRTPTAMLDAAKAQAARAFTDYLASALAARREEPVQALAQWIGRDGSGADTALLLGRTECASPEQAALFNGFLSHYLDYDDAQANIAGHFSTVLFSALLAVTDERDSLEDLLAAYSIGAEVEGLLGARLNPAHKIAGWHSTGTVGPLGAAAAIGRLRGLDEESLIQVLSFSGTQSAGMGFEAGSDAKPLHAGLAARNAVFAYRLVKATSLRAAANVFNDETGWLHTLSKVPFEATRWEREWFSPGQLIVPGLWMKLHPYCSAAICGASACRQVRRDFEVAGYDWESVAVVVFDFPVGADTALRYKAPRTGQEGRFSMEYVGWQELALGGIRDRLFAEAAVPSEFEQALREKTFKREHNLVAADATDRLTKVSVRMKDGTWFSAMETTPLGSPKRPLSDERLHRKLCVAVGEARAERLRRLVKHCRHRRLHWPAVISRIMNDEDEATETERR